MSQVTEIKWGGVHETALNAEPTLPGGEPACKRASHVVQHNQSPHTDVYQCNAKKKSSELMSVTVQVRSQTKCGENFSYSTNTGAKYLDINESRVHGSRISEDLGERGYKEK